MKKQNKRNKLTDNSKKIEKLQESRFLNNTNLTSTSRSRGNTSAQKSNLFTKKKQPTNIALDEKDFKKKLKKAKTKTSSKLKIKNDNQGPPLTERNKTPARKVTKRSKSKNRSAKRSASNKKTCSSTGKKRKNLKPSNNRSSSRGKRNILVQFKKDLDYFESKKVESFCCPNNLFQNPKKSRDKKSQSPQRKNNNLAKSTVYSGSNNFGLKQSSPARLVRKTKRKYFMNTFSNSKIVESERGEQSGQNKTTLELIKYTG